MKGQDLEKIIKKEEEVVRGIHIFSNERRRRIFMELTKFPCRTSSSLSRILNMDVRDVEWHLKKLVERDFVFTWKDRKKYYCVKNLVRKEDLAIFSLFNVPGILTLMRKISGECREISYFSIKKSTLYRYLKELKSLHLVGTVGIEKKLICATPKFRKMIEKYDEIGREYKSIILKKLEMPGYEVKNLGTINYELKVSIGGFENFSMSVFISPLRTILEVYE